VLGKAAAVALAFINVKEAITKALTAGPILGPIAAAAIGFAGMKQVKDIISTQVPGGGGGGISIPGDISAPSSNNLGRIADVDLTAPQTTVSQAPAVRAYVLTGDINSSQEADSRLNNRRSLG